MITFEIATNKEIRSESQCITKDLDGVLSQITRTTESFCCITPNWPRHILRRTEIDSQIVALGHYSLYMRWRRRSRLRCLSCGNGPLYLGVVTYATTTYGWVCRRAAVSCQAQSTARKDTTCGYRALHIHRQLYTVISSIYKFSITAVARIRSLKSMLVEFLLKCLCYKFPLKVQRTEYFVP